MGRPGKTTMRSREPVIWALFGAGGMISALIFPAVVGVLWIAIPLGWLEAPVSSDRVEKLGHPLFRLAVFGIATLAFYHWAHRFRYTLYDGLQLHHLNQLIAIICYGGATALTVLSAYLLWAA